MNRLLWTLSVLFAAASVGASENLVIRVYHTNDVHGWIMPRPDKFQPTRSVGGAAALKALVNKDSGAKLVVDAGDWWQGTPEGSLTKGEAVTKVFNAVGYDAVEIGNHEFDAGVDALKSLVGKLNMPALAANIYGPDGKHTPWAKPHILKEVAGVKVGLFGLLTVHMDRLAFPKNIEGIKFRREVLEARDQVALLKKEGADVIIALTHIGYETPDGGDFEGDQTLAREVAGIDLIVGGHTHTALTRAWRDANHGTLVVQAGSYLTKVGRTTLTIDKKSRRVIAAKDELLDLWADLVGQDPAVKGLVDAAQEEVGEQFKLVVATATASLEKPRSGPESGLGSWMADCYRDWAGADAAFQNTGGIRAAIPAGPVTLRDLFNVMPFDNMMVTMKMTGKQLRSALDHAMGAARPVQVGGLTASYHVGAPSGMRLETVTVAGAPLDDERTYSVTTLDFMVTGGDRYDEFVAASPVQTGTLARDVLRSCAEKQKMIAPPAAGRLKPLGD